MAAGSPTTEKSLSGAERPPAASSQHESPKEDTQTSLPKKKPKPNSAQTHHQSTLRTPQWIYFHLKLYTHTPSAPLISLDAITARRHFTAGLTRSFGLIGLAIPIDILKLENEEVWIRVPRDDAKMVHEAIAGWSGEENGGQKWIVRGRDEWLVRLGGGNGEDLSRAKE